jgi:FtsZ-interacting cell division protein ZipA
MDGNKIPYKFLIIVGGIILLMFVIKLLFGKRKSKEEIKLEQEKRELELQRKSEELKQKLEKEKTETEKEKIKAQTKLIELKEKKEIAEFDKSNKNPLNDTYQFSKNYSPTKIFHDKNSYKTALEIDKELSKMDVNEEKVINLFNDFRTKDEIAHWRKYFAIVRKSDWVKKIANSFKGLTDPYEDLRRLYNVIINKK